MDVDTNRNAPYPTSDRNLLCKAGNPSPLEYPRPQLLQEIEQNKNHYLSSD